MRTSGTAEHRRGPLLSRFVGTVMTVVALVLVSASPAAAHAELVRSDPASGAVFDTSPVMAQLWFSEDVQPAMSSVRLLDESGRDVAGVAIAAEGDSPDLVEVRLPPLGPGTYGIWWNVTAEDDGHTTRGVVVFGVGAAPSAVSPDIGSTGNLSETWLRWLHLMALVGAVGGLIVLTVVVSRVTRREDGPAYTRLVATVRRRLLTLVALGGVLGASGGLVLLVRQRMWSDPDAPPGRIGLVEELTQTRWGTLWLVQEAAFLLLVLVVGLLARGGSARQARRQHAVAVLAVSALVVTEAASSHAAGVATGRAAVMAADAVHVLAACVWLAALAAVVVILVTRSSSPVVNRDLRHRCRGPLSSLLAGSVAAILVTGLFGAGREVRDVSDLWNTTYGRLLVLKVALFGVMAMLGAVNSARLHGLRPGWRRPPAGAPPASQPTKQLVVLEAGVGAVVLIVVAILIATAPPRDGVGQAEAASDGRSSATRGDLVVSLVATPDRPGNNGFTVVAASTRRPAIAPIRRVDLVLQGDRGTRVVGLRPIAANTYFGIGVLSQQPADGVTVVVHRSIGVVEVPVPWSVQREPTATRTRLAPWTDGLALGLVCLVAIGLVIFNRRRDRGDDSSPVELQDRPLDLIGGKSGEL